MKFKEECEVMHKDKSSKNKNNIFNNNYDNELKKWLSEIDGEGMTVNLVFVDINIAGVNSIDFYQNGYSGDTWKNSWVVFAKWGGADPIIYDSSTKEILIAMHGMGTWEVSLISPNFDKFDLILSTWCRIAKQYNSILDDDCELKEDFIDNLREELEKNIHTKYIEAFLNFITF